MKNDQFNVLFISADQFRADCMSCAGHEIVRTPNLDRLASEGVRFSKHYTNCLPCGPSRASLLTGSYQMNHRVVRNGTPLDASLTNLAECVRTVGYEPWLIGYTDTTLDPRLFHKNDPRIRRADQILPGMLQFSPGSEYGVADRAWREMLRSAGYEHWDDPYRQASLAASPIPTFAPSQIRSDHTETAFATDCALRFIAQQGNESWFLHLSYLRPHPPLVAPEPWYSMYDPETVPDFVGHHQLADELRLHPYLSYRLSSLEKSAALPPDASLNNNPTWRQARAIYYGLISELDHHIGRILDYLEGSGKSARTLVIFLSDHGEMLGDHWCWGKEFPFNQAAQVPFIIRSPLQTQRSKGTVVTRFTEHVDIMPTILEHLGADIPLQCDGHSLVPFLGDEGPVRWRSDVFWEHDFRDVVSGVPETLFGMTLDECNMSVIRTDYGKYIYFPSLPAIFFNLKRDPNELVNLSGNPDSVLENLQFAQRMLNRRMAYNRRDLTGWSVDETGITRADRMRRVS